MSALITEGDTAQEALHNADDALSALAEAYQELGRPLPIEKVGSTDLSVGMARARLPLVANPVPNGGWSHPP